MAMNSVLLSLSLNLLLAIRALTSLMHFPSCVILASPYLLCIKDHIQLCVICIQMKLNTVLLCYSVRVFVETEQPKYRTLLDSIWECALPRSHAMYNNCLDPIFTSPNQEQHLIHHNSFPISGTEYHGLHAVANATVTVKSNKVIRICFSLSMAHRRASYTLTKAVSTLCHSLHTD